MSVAAVAATFGSAAARRHPRRWLHQAAIGLTAASAALGSGGAPGLAFTRAAHAAGDGPERGAPEEPSVVVRWNSAALDAIRRQRPGPPMAARALAILHTCIYDTWAAYDAVAAGTRLGGALRRPDWERTPANKDEAISLAAYLALVDLYPSESGPFTDLLRRLGYDPPATAAISADPRTPRDVGAVAAQAVLDFRHGDGANQLGDLAPEPYGDYTGYAPLNDVDRVTDPNRWQPLRVSDGRGGTVVQKCLAPHWGRVTPFAMPDGTHLRPDLPPAIFPSGAYRAQAEQILEHSAALTDREKVISEYWADGAGSDLPPGHWNRLAQTVSRRDGHDLDADVRLFFVLTNALLDASIACWDCKLATDYVRPITAVRTLFKGRRVWAWTGPYRGAGWVDGADWRPYQTATTLTPPFPEFVSGHSAFSAAGAEILRRFTGSDALGLRYTRPAQTSLVEPAAIPAADVTLSWATFSEAADQAGLSRRYGGIHFEDGDLRGRAMGRQVAALAWARAQAYFDGTA